MKKVELDIVALSHSVTNSHNYAVVLGESEGNRRLPIIIGGFEAQAIAVAMEKMAPNRPLTHDLFRNTLDAFNVTLKEIVINNLLDGIFYARMVCFRDGELIEIDSRTSDAIAMAVRFECPIYTYEFIMEQAGVVLDEQEAAQQGKSIKKKKPSPKVEELSIEQMSVENLEKLLSKVLSNEDYEKAAKIRDELNNRNGIDSGQS
jgi:bifunctional DNase/RNase